LVSVKKFGWDPAKGISREQKKGPFSMDFRKRGIYAQMSFHTRSPEYRNRKLRRNRKKR
jgi:hypothetical protein